MTSLFRASYSDAASFLRLSAGFSIIKICPICAVRFKGIMFNSLVFNKPVPLFAYSYSQDRGESVSD